MKYISSLEIENFRVFDYLKLEKLGKINVLFGKNNCGKSSILEAILLMKYDKHTMTDNSYFEFIRNEDIKYLFNNFNFSPIKIKVITSTEIILVKVIHNEDNSVYIESNQNKIFNPVLPLKLQNSKMYKDIIIKRRDRNLFDFLKNIDSRIEAIHLLDNNIYFGLKNIKELIPINLMGDGIKQIFNILASISNDYNLILIDEIENGLHYTAHKELWESIIKLQKDFDFQLFITTHSLETLKALKEVLEDEKNKDMRDEVKAINIVHTKKAGIKAYNYGFESFKKMIDTETEMR